MNDLLKGKENSFLKNTKNHQKVLMNAIE